VLEQEGLPSATPLERLKAGELRVLAATKSAQFVEGIQQPQVVARSRTENSVEAATV
jgi:hypothetical protein